MINAKQSIYISEPRSERRVDMEVETETQMETERKTSDNFLRSGVASIRHNKLIWIKLDEELAKEMIIDGHMELINIIYIIDCCT